MRKPIAKLSLTIADQADAVRDGWQFDDIIDCTSDGAPHDCMDKVLHIPPSGKNSHNWTLDDLDTLVELAVGCLSKHRRVLIHCGRGVSRSTSAAAAVLLHMGHAQTVEEALRLTRHPDREPVKTAVASLTVWWSRRDQHLF